MPTKPMFEHRHMTQLTAEDLGRLFARAGSDDQAAFLVEAATCAASYSWPMQCRHIINEIKDPCIAGFVRSWLQTLIDHVDERHTTLVAMEAENVRLAT